MRRLSENQKRLLQLVRKNPGLNTSQLATLRRDWQAYESYLRDRLFRLADRGLVRFEERQGNEGWVIERKWFPAEKEKS